MLMSASLGQWHSCNIKMAGRWPAFLITLCARLRLAFQVAQVLLVVVVVAARPSSPKDAGGQSRAIRSCSHFARAVFSASLKTVHSTPAACSPAKPFVHISAPRPKRVMVSGPFMISPFAVSCCIWG